jgi:hypothetical protein
LRSRFYFEVEAVLLGPLTVTIVVKTDYHKKNVVSGRVLVEDPGQCLLWDYMDWARTTAHIDTLRRRRAAVHDELGGVRPPCKK